MKFDALPNGLPHSNSVVTSVNPTIKRVVCNLTGDKLPAGYESRVLSNYGYELG